MKFLLPLLVCFTTTPSFAMSLISHTCSNYSRTLKIEGYIEQNKTNLFLEPDLKNLKSTLDAATYESQSEIAYLQNLKLLSVYNENSVRVYEATFYTAEQQKVMDDLNVKGNGNIIILKDIPEAYTEIVVCSI